MTINPKLFQMQQGVTIKYSDGIKSILLKNNESPRNLFGVNKCQYKQMVKSGNLYKPN